MSDDHMTHYRRDACGPDGHRTDPYLAGETNTARDCVHDSSARCFCQVDLEAERDEARAEARRLRDGISAHRIGMTGGCAWGDWGIWRDCANCEERDGELWSLLGNTGEDNRE